MDNFVKDMKIRVDSMTEDQLVYMFVPEIIHLKDIYEKRGDKEKTDGCMEILKYIKARVELDNYKVFDDLGNTKLKVPQPSEIINQKTLKGIPNN